MSEAAHAGASDLADAALTGGAPDALRVRGLETALLAPSRFSRVGDEMTAAVQAASCNPDAFGDGSPFASVTGNATNAAGIEWDAWHDSAPPQLSAASLKRRRADTNASQESAMLAALSMPAVAALLAADDAGALLCVDDRADTAAAHKRARLDDGDSRIADLLRHACGDSSALRASVARGGASSSPSSAAAGAGCDSRGIPIAGAHTERAVAVGRPRHNREADAERRALALAKTLHLHHEKFRESWDKRAGGSMTTQNLEFFAAAYDRVAATGMRDIANACFEESQLLPFEAQLKDGDGS